MDRLAYHTSSQAHTKSGRLRHILPLTTKLTLIFTLFALYACSIANNTYNPLDDYEDLTPYTIMDAPESNGEQFQSYDPKQTAKGKYLVEVLGCGTCHTNGALIGTPDFDRRMAGSSVGIAYSNPLKEKNPGVVFPPNLTPDIKTGIGSWSKQQVMRAIHHGINKEGKPLMTVMPWPAYSKISPEDAEAIAAYLRGLAPVEHQVPLNVEPGTETSALYVHFGVYRNRQ